MKGRKPTPTKLKILCGNPGKQRLPKNEPQPATDKPVKPPDFLKGYALEEFLRVEPGLRALGLLCELDQSTLAVYCCCYAHWREALEEARDLQAADPDAILNLHDKKGNGGTLRVLFGIASKAAADMVRYAAEFGMTPSARARLGLDWQRGGKSKFDGLLGMKP